MREKEKKKEEDMLREKSNNPNLKGGEQSKNKLTGHWIATGPVGFCTVLNIVCRLHFLTGLS